ncbi:hypothetical protein HZY91_07635 [Facklamia sp. DSM 111018]|uniref:Competence protein CoiA nuclease-like domain-containing protein n=1 Tax=Facklamia lactis TaxID=2749967 RepID=A0ABS0LRH0_9LACT|nr:competence protein CoiA family protein [Facklamia lactis]MBG9980870.1 hypothetical protein [Facklamia lactis]MBG9986767.1 hypothetical protein [Facklamia lactis]
MYAALDLEGVLIYASEANLGNCYYCPQCGQRMSLIIKKNGRNFFRHLPQKNVELGRDKQLKIANKGESKEHRKGKLLLCKMSQQFYSSVQMEYPIPKINQIVDVYITNQQQPVILEYQRSIISASCLQTRQRAYRKWTGNVFWLIDHQYFLDHQESEWIWRNLQYNSSWHFYIVCLDITRKEMVIYYNFPVIYYNENYYTTGFAVEMGEDWISLLKEPQYLNFVKLQHFIGKKYKKKAARSSLISKNPSYRKYLINLYQKNIYLDQIPQWCLKKRWRIIFFQEPAWYIWAWVWKFEYDRRGLMANNFDDFKIYILGLMNRKLMTWRDMPLLEVSADYVCRCLWEVYKQQSVNGS